MPDTHQAVWCGSSYSQFTQLLVNHKTLSASRWCHTVTLFNTLSGRSKGKHTVEGQTGRQSEAHIDILPCNSFQHSARHTLFISRCSDLIRVGCTPLSRCHRMRRAQHIPSWRLDVNWMAVSVYVSLCHERQCDTSIREQISWRLLWVSTREQNTFSRKGMLWHLLKKIMCALRNNGVTYTGWAIYRIISIRLV